MVLWQSSELDPDPHDHHVQTVPSLKTKTNSYLALYEYTSEPHLVPELQGLGYVPEYTEKSKNCSYSSQLENTSVNLPRDGFGSSSLLDTNILPKIVTT